MCVDTKQLEWMLAFTRQYAQQQHTASPVVQICGVAQPGPEGLQQGPGGAARHSFGPLGWEVEPDGPVVREADVAMRPIGHVLYKPLHVCHGEVMDMERSSWTTSVNRDTKPVFIYTRARDGEISQVNKMNVDPEFLGSVKCFSMILMLWLSV